jgi:hypothetical protein
MERNLEPLKHAKVEYSLSAGKSLSVWQKTPKQVSVPKIGEVGSAGSIRINIVPES